MALKFLTLDMIKAHLRIDDEPTPTPTPTTTDGETDTETTEEASDDEPTPSALDVELTLFGEAIEQEAFSFMERSYDSLIVEFGSVPADIKLACLAHLASAYKTREDQQDRKKGMAATKMPYAWEAKLIKYKPGNKI